MIGVALIERPPEPPSQQDDPNEVEQRYGQDEERDEDGPSVRVERRIEMRKDSQDSQQITDDMAAGVPKKRARAREIVREEAKQGPECRESNEGNQILASGRGDDSEIPSADGPESSA